ncbi:hypothetical protein PGB90_006435 [Kerria lacca]
MMSSCFSQKLLNDIHLSLCFTILFTAFNTQSHIQKTLTVSIQRDNPSYNADGYVCFGIIYTFLALGMWLSPSFIAITGWKISLGIGAFCYLSFVTFSYFEIGWLTYSSSAITGIGAALLWTAQANYIVLNSEIGDVYPRMHLTFMSVIAASLGFTKYISPNSREYAPLSGVLQGFGEIIGSCLSLYFKEKAFFKLNVIMTTATLSNVFGYVIAILGLPDTSAYGYTEEYSLIKIPITFLLLSNILIGMGDACLHIALYNYIGTLYPNDSASGFAVFKFIRCLATACSFYYSNIIGLHLQLMILFGISFLSLIGFHYSLHTSLKTTRKLKEKPQLSEFCF